MNASRVKVAENADVSADRAARALMFAFLACLATLLGLAIFGGWVVLLLALQAAVMGVFKTVSPAKANRGGNAAA